jgi:hypothetical protein
VHSCSTIAPLAAAPCRDTKFRWSTATPGKSVSSLTSSHPPSAPPSPPCHASPPRAARGPHAMLWPPAPSQSCKVLRHCPLVQLVLTRRLAPFAPLTELRKCVIVELELSLTYSMNHSVPSITPTTINGGTWSSVRRPSTAFPHHPRHCTSSLLNPPPPHVEPTWNPCTVLDRSPLLRRPRAEPTLLLQSRVTAGRVGTRRRRRSCGA